MLTKLQREEEFDDSLLRSNSQNKLILVKFFTTWCGPCQQLQQPLSKLSEEKKNLLIIEVDADKFSTLAQRAEFNVQSIPALFLLQQGQVIKKAVGSIESQQLIKQLKESI